MKKEIWLFMAVLSLFIFNWPFIEIFKNDVFRYLFITWLAFIALAAIIAKGENK